MPKLFLVMSLVLLLQGCAAAVGAAVGIGTYAGLEEYKQSKAEKGQKATVQSAFKDTGNKISSWF